MGRYSGKTCRLSTMLMLTASFFLVEIIVGYITNSVALIADSFHMLSDVVALIVGFASVRISKWPSKRNTYGWVRAEVLGALVNAVFLLALCFSIIVEALKRLVDVERVDNPKLLLIVGGAGLLVNVIGLFLFGAHGHSHGGHGHSHGDHGHSHGGQKPEHSPEKVYLDIQNGDVGKPVENEALVQPELPSSVASTEERDLSPSENLHSIAVDIKKPKLVSSQQLNMRGVFLHVLGDALGSLVVIVSALIIWFADGEWKYYVDPALSIVMVIIILSTTIPLLKESAFILLQTVPSHVNVDNIIKELEKMEGIYGVHECHIWQLAGNRIVASAHIRCHGIEEYMILANKIKDLFHKVGIHSTTIQPEFIDWQDINSDHQPCTILCNTTGEQCKGDTCCGGRSKKIKKTNSSGSKIDEVCIEVTEEAVSPTTAAATTAGGVGVVGGNTNSSNSRNLNPCTFSSLRSLDMKFSPDGDEVVLEMSDFMRPRTESGSRSHHTNQLPASPVPASPSGQTGRTSADQSLLPD